MRSSFPVADHIGAVAATSGALIGCNWDARTFYEWTLDGKQTQAIEHDGSARYQDLQWTSDGLLAGGLIGDQGVVDLLEWPSLDLKERIVVGKSDRGTVLTAEGMAVSGGELLLMPEDDPSRVFVHRWAGARTSETAPTTDERAREVAVQEADTVERSQLIVTSWHGAHASAQVMHVASALMT